MPDRIGQPGTAEPIGLYVHWPFCLSKCPYCDFNSHVRDRVDHAAWCAALLSELDHAAARMQGETGPRRLASIFFGGGTPSLMDPGTVGAVIERARRHWPAEPDIEITLEANPTSAETGNFAAFAEAGVNRVSLGVQSLRPGALTFLGRQHDAGQALAAVEMAARTFPRHSFDLIYARPEQDLEDWRAELTEALDHANGHLSVYQLTIEPGTAFHTEHRLGRFKTPDEEKAAAFFDVTQEVLEAHGMPGYEVSNHAVPGQESRHNLIYWRYRDYVGIGPGAHGRVTIGGTKRAQRRFRLPEKWLSQVQENGHGTEEDSPLDAMDRAAECLMMGLRLTEGVPLARLEEEGGQEALPDPARIARLVEEGYVTFDGGVIACTTEGRLRLNSVIDFLLS
ncbi:radical SAM family heme chaperone HemW [Hwanghaeella sp.]|uniref:radical SAM family heme chaperone HemW n=1 Tax=Hwanghaeella sp. TaxID=2605943 RepID=UPI003CCBBCEC